MPTKATKQIRVTELAAQRVEEIIDALNATGRSISRTSYLSDLILEQPVPNQPEKKQPRRRPQQPRTIVTAQA